MHKPIKYVEKGLTYVARGAWTVFDALNSISPNESFTPNWSEKPLLKSWQKVKPPLGWPRETDSLCPTCVREARQEIPTAGTLEAEAKAYFISPTTGNVFPVFSNDALLGRFDSVTGMHPEVDLSNEDQSRNISRRHARLVIKDGKPYVAEEIGTMNGTFLNGKKLANGVLTPLEDGDELVLCRLTLHFKLPK